MVIKQLLNKAQYDIKRFSDREGGLLYAEVDPVEHIMPMGD